MGETEPVVGQPYFCSGNITQLKSIGFTTEYNAEMLGYAPATLSKGYWILLLKDSLTPHHFKFGGTTLRASGREGLLLPDPEQDRNRPSVHKQILSERGTVGYTELQFSTLKTIPMVGPDRLAKLKPVIPYDPLAPLTSQYRMGGGALQWEIKKRYPRKFLVAAKICPNGPAETSEFTVDLNDRNIDAQVRNRTRLREYLNRA